MQLSAQAESNAAATQLAHAMSTCAACHSGGVMGGAVACENAECDVLYLRLGAARRQAAAALKLQRLALSEPW